jgi:hypothetical protein
MLIPRLNQFDRGSDGSSQSLRCKPPQVGPKLTTGGGSEYAMPLRMGDGPTIADIAQRLIR